MKAARCRCGHAKGDHGPSLAWRAGTLRGLCAGACGLCDCRAFRLLALTPGQIEGLAQLSGGKLTPFEATIRIGRAHRRTLGSLQRAGLVRFFPFARAGQSAWGLTPAGRQTIAQLLEAGVLYRAPWETENPSQGPSEV